MAAKELGYDRKGFNVIHGAVSYHSGTTLFPYDPDHKEGIENVGIENTSNKMLGLVLSSSVQNRGLDGIALRSTRATCHIAATQKNWDV